jgi:hypothetical protein
MIQAPEGTKQISLAWAGNTKGGSITLPLTSCSTSLDLSVLQIKTYIASCHTTDSKPVKQEFDGTVILPPLVFPERFIRFHNFLNSTFFKLLQISIYIYSESKPLRSQLKLQDVKVVPLKV